MIVAAAIVILPLPTGALTVHVGVAVNTCAIVSGVRLVTVQVVSALLNPEPEIEKVPPSLTTPGLMVIEGENALTSKVADAKSPVLPVTVTVYVPTVLVATTKLALTILPFVIVHAGEEIRPEGALVIVVHASPVLNPLPVIFTPVLNGPELGVSAIVGPVTMKFAVPKSPVVPRTFTTYVPGVTGLPTVNAVPVN